MPALGTSPAMFYLFLINPVAISQTRSKRLIETSDRANRWPCRQSSPLGQTNGKNGLSRLPFGHHFEESQTLSGQGIQYVGSIIQKADQWWQIKNYDQNDETAGYFLVDLASRLWLKRHDNDLNSFSYRHPERFLAVRTPCRERGFGIELAITKNNLHAMGAISNVVLLFIHTI